MQRMLSLVSEFQRIVDLTLDRRLRLSRVAVLALAVFSWMVLPDWRRSYGDDLPIDWKPSKPVAEEGAKGAEPLKEIPQRKQKVEVDPNVAGVHWPEGATVEGRVVDHHGKP